MESIYGEIGWKLSDMSNIFIHLFVILEECIINCVWVWYHWLFFPQRNICFRKFRLCNI